MNLASSPSSDAEETESKNGHDHSLDIRLSNLNNRDLAILGAQEMLDEAGSAENTKFSQNVFVRGRTRDNRFIQVDLEKDAVEYYVDNVDISVDIDSVIWVTHKLQFKGPMNLHLLPLLGGQAPV